MAFYNDHSVICRDVPALPMVSNSFRKDILRNVPTAQSSGEHKNACFKRQAEWIKEGPQYTTYCLLLGFSRKRLSRVGPVSRSVS
jgi:hypothetical protein